ncbi:LPXTG cell wall anchor domain-containing protein [Exiguobacterium sp. TNDT2]|uniref:LPXTG cell wall anchor domain-containing protein n=1 Tax=Exiguobacterium sp. TNDT2 TaxID=2233531 RepID=UPI000DEEF1A4|nr:LPXTG cell wall anchor domain-containing protein [Exiguobacterium sp. TNDT2]
MQHTNRRFIALITFILVLIGMWAPHGSYANTPMTSTSVYALIDLSTEEIEAYDDASLIYGDVTYYGARETSTIWRFMIDATEVDLTTIDQVTLYDKAGVPYSFPGAVYAFQIEELAGESSESGDDGTETVPDIDTPVEPPLVEPEPSPEEPVTEEVTAPSATPAVAIDQLILGADGPIERVLGGDLVTYRLVIDVTGTPIENLSVSNTVPEALTVVADSVEVLGPEGSVAPTTVSGPPAFYWTFPTIPVGTTTIQFDTFAPDVMSETVVTNTFCIGVEDEIVPSACTEATVTVVPNESIGLEVGKEANIDQAVVGGVIPYTFVIENTGETALTITTIADEFFSGDIDAQAVEVFNANVREQLMALIGENGLAAGERVEATVNLMIPSDYDRTNAPEIGNVFRVAATDSYGRVIDAESQQIVLLNQADFMVTKVASPGTVHPGEAIRYTYTITNTSNVTLYFVDVIDEWTSGALTTEEQRETTETLRDGIRALAEVENGLIPGEEIVLEMEKVLLPSYDVRAGAVLTNRTTFTFEVNREARVSRTAEATVHVKQLIPEREDDAIYVPEPTTPVTPDQATLPMTGSAGTWGTVIGLVLIVFGLMFLIHRRRPSTRV